MKGNFGFDPRTLTVNFPVLTSPHLVLQTGESIFDAEPTIPFPKFVPPSMQNDGGKAKHKEKSAGVDFYTNEKPSQGCRTSTSRYGNMMSYHATRKWTEAPKDVSLHVLRHGQLTPPGAGSPTSQKSSEAMKGIPTKEASPRKTRRVRTEVETPASSSSSISPVLSRGATLDTIKDQPTGKATRKRRASAPLSQEKKRKLSLEKNRIAAARCRVNKQQKEDQLQARSRELVSSNKLLRKTVLDMNSDLRQLQSMLKIHLESGSCAKAPADIREGLAASIQAGVVDDGFCSDKDPFQPLPSLLQELCHPESHHEEHMSVDDDYLETLSPLDSLSSAWERLLPSLDLEPDIESNFQTNLFDSASPTHAFSENEGPTEFTVDGELLSSLLQSVG